PGLSSRLPEVLLGILKAGATCLAPEPPSEEGDENRLSSPPESEAFLMVTPHTPVAGEPGAETRIVRFDSSRELVEGRNGTTSTNPVAEGNLALIAYTSGTTGRPGRVMLTHRGLSNQVLGLAETVGLSEEDRVLWRGVWSTNLSIWELFAPLLAGGCLIAVPPAAAQNPGLLLRLMAEEQITTACLTPATHALLLREGAGHDGRMAGRVVLSGEMFYRPAGQAFCGRSAASLFNVYSVGEASGAVTAEVCDRQSERTIVPIGRPLADTQAYLLDRHLEPVPAGVMGEIWIGGAGLARGYAEHPERTAESFRPNPFAQNPGERMFRAQDLGRSLPDGKMQILGHLEHQFKTRFGPINPTLIESALMEDSGIDQAVLLSSNGSGAEVRWTAYLGSHGPSAPSADAWRRDLRERLPAHLIPQHVVTMACLPLTADGRIDRTATAIKAEGLATETGIAEPGSPYEEMLRGIWANLFGVNEVGRDENFFELGGHSLLATQMISRAREAFQLEIPLQYVFETPTIEGLGRKIEQLIRTGRGRHSPPLVGVPRTGRLPLSFAQQRLWFIEQLEPGKAAYNCHIGLRLKGQVDLAALERSISEIVRRHEVLRTRIEVVESMPIQAIDEWRPLRLEVEDLRGLGAPERAEEVKRRSTQELATGFDLSRGPLFRLKMLGLAEEDHVLLFTIHHIVSDAWSMSLLVNEVVRLYEAFTTGAASPLPDLKIQYADYASWQQRHFSEEVVEEHLQYWRNRLSGRPPVINLAGDHPRPPVPSHRGAVKVMALPAELYDALKSLSRREDVTIFMMLLAAFKVLLYRYTSESDLVVGTTLANRNRAEIEDLIGFFINMLPMRTSLDGNPRFTQLLKRIKDTALGAYAHQELPFEKLVEALQPEREVGQTPLFNIAFGVQNAPKTVMKLKGLELSSVASEQESVRFDLTLWITENGETMRAGWTYRTDLFSEETIVRMHAHFETLLFSIMARPDAPLDELEMRSEAERAQQLSGQAAREEHRYRKFKSVKPKAIAISND
ncbi:MAG TPA: condensation domain-containing protein, partial [Blastocatellia bacterium]|nr:condensation domain-containing protein [Blastocatellia bacterium]